jgi:chloramphenicol O-acetyltransferase
MEIFPSTNCYNNYTAHIYICSNGDLNYYKNDPSLVGYLHGKSISIEYNDLDSVVPSNIGFIENLKARDDTIELNSQRVKELLREDAPHFTMTVQSLHGPDKQQTRPVIHVKRFYQS